MDLLGQGKRAVVWLLATGLAGLTLWVLALA
jgi:hypothetical protein